MKGITGYVAGAVILAVLGVVCLGASRLDRELAHAQQALLTSQYIEAEASLGIVDRYDRYMSRIAGVNSRSLSDVQTRKAALSYWQREYGTLVPRDRTDPVADVPAENIPFQLIVADAVYRDGQPRGKDRTTSLAVLESAISAYRAVLNNARRPEDEPSAQEAAYNYEYVVRLRSDILRGRRRALPPPADDPNFGSEGEPEKSEFQREFQQYIPLEKEERDPDAGSTAPPPRKG